MAVHNLAPAPGVSRSASRLSRRDTALYARDLLHALKTIALGQRQLRFADLLEAAAAEADRLAAEEAARASRK